MVSSREASSGENEKSRSNYAFFHLMGGTCPSGFKTPASISCSLTPMWQSDPFVYLFYSFS